jgi:hypothetical protein
MSSVDAILFYGYLWSDEEDDGEIACAIHSETDPSKCSSNDWDSVVYARRGHLNPWSNFTEDERLPYAERQAATARWVEENREAIDRLHKEQAEIRAEFGVSLSSHGHYDCSVPHLLVVGTKQTVSFTEGLALAPSMLAVDPDWRDRLDKWLAEFGIAAPQPEPKWWMVAHYG